MKNKTPIRSVLEENIAKANGRAGEGLNALTCLKLLDRIDHLERVVKLQMLFIGILMLVNWGIILWR